MAQSPEENISGDAPREPSPRRRTFTRRQAIAYGLGVLAGLSGAGALVYHAIRSATRQLALAVFKGDAPQGTTWELWRGRGWAREAGHYLKLGRNTQCKLCPNDCLLEPEDRGRCRNRVNKDGTLYTLAYGNACTVHVDPIEKKPLFHFMPATTTFSLAASGCGFRCLNCQNWELSQAKPEETKDPTGGDLRLDPRSARGVDLARVSIFPEDVVGLATQLRCPSVSCTYSEPTSWFEYMNDIYKAARERRIKSVWVTCGYIQREPLLELCRSLDAADVDLKSFSDDIYRRLNSGKLQPVLDTLRTLKERNVWFEVSYLVVPTWSDDLAMLGRMYDWLLANLGPGYPLHLLRFHPAHQLTHLPPTPAETMVRARDLAIKAGLHFVYIGNLPGVPDALTTFCPSCHKPVVEREVFAIRRMDIDNSECKFCRTPIPGVWTT